VTDIEPFLTQLKACRKGMAWATRNVDDVGKLWDSSPNVEFLLFGWRAMRFDVKDKRLFDFSTSIIRTFPEPIPAIGIAAECRIKAMVQTAKRKINWCAAVGSSLWMCAAAVAMSVEGLDWTSEEAAKAGSDGWDAEQFRQAVILRNLLPNPMVRSITALTGDIQP
jgi:hypothetical protein